MPKILIVSFSAAVLSILASLSVFLFPAVPHELGREQKSEAITPLILEDGVVNLATGQEADLVVSAKGFNETGGALLFNHPGGIASDGQRLILADRNNNRVLIWNELPNGNEEPDLVLGQPDFHQNNPGVELHQMNWPIAVAVADGRLYVADTNNHRILVWKEFPTTDQQPADFALETEQAPGEPQSPHRLAWPWAVWTDGEKLVVASTGSQRVYIWSSAPEKNVPPDIVLRNNAFGTPRSIASDGVHLAIGDHNAKVTGGRGVFFWNEFPTRDDEPYDFFDNTPGFSEPTGGPQNAGEYLHGATVTSDGKFVGINNAGLFIWNQFPTDSQGEADMHFQRAYDFGGGQSGDGASVAAAGGKLFVSLTNGNKVVVFDPFPTSESERPDFAIGAPDIQTNTLLTEGFVTNPVPATDGKSLFVISDFDRTLSVWKQMPTESGVPPDFVQRLEPAPRSIGLAGDKLFVAAESAVFVWNELPRNGEKPDRVWKRNAREVAYDGTYFSLIENDKGLVWKGVPAEDDPSLFEFDAKNLGTLSSDGEYLVAIDREARSVVVYRFADVESGKTKPAGEIREGMGGFNLPQHALVSAGHLFIADTNHDRVVIWNDVEEALAGISPDVILGNVAMKQLDNGSRIGKAELFWPGKLAWDGAHLWVGEFKFSGRLLRFSER